MAKTVQNGPKMAKNDQKWAKNDQKTAPLFGHRIWAKKWSKNVQKGSFLTPKKGPKKGSVDPQGNKKLGGKLFGGGEGKKG